MKEKKQYLINQLKQDINQLLSKTDWAIVRKFERGIDIPESVINERIKILSDCDSIEAEILALNTIEDVENYKIIL